MSEQQDLDLYKAYPQLKEKAIVDYLNGIEVADDLIRVRESVNAGYLARIWQDLTGQSHGRQQQIDENFATSLKTASDWLQVLQNNQVQSDLAITVVSNKLVETRQGLMLLQTHHKELKAQVNGLIEHCQQLNVKFSKFEKKLIHVDAGRLATQQMQAMFDKWKVGQLQGYPVLVRLYLILDELYWGDFGNYCRRLGAGSSEIQRLVEQVKNKALIQLKEDLVESGIGTDQTFIWQEDLFNALQKLSDEKQKALVFLTDYGTEDKMPMPWVINYMLSSQKSKEFSFNDIPYIFDANNAVEYVTRSFRRRYEIES